jgi:hypothetical protein
LRRAQVVLLENCRCNKGEKKDDEGLARRMAALCDIYVNDAFGTAHRAEATTHGIARFAPIACAGPLLAAELDALGKALHAPRRPLVAIVAGSKVSTKLTILKSLADKVDQLIVGGGIANTFLLAAGKPIGKSLAEADLVDQAREIIDAMARRGASVPLPSDVVVATEFSAQAQARTVSADAVGAGDMILDIGPESGEALAKIIEGAGTIVWNGPVGVFEFDQFAGGTRRLAQAIAVVGVLHRRRRRYPGRHREVRHHRTCRLHLHRRRRIPRVPRRAHPSGRRCARGARRGLTRAVRRRARAARPSCRVLSSSVAGFCATLGFSSREPDMQTPRATKIVATLGPASSDPVTLERLIGAGVNVVRVNFSHGTAQEHTETVRRVREIAERLGAASACSPISRARRSASASSPRGA